jgi:pilus assembly protein CpaE
VLPIRLALAIVDEGLHREVSAVLADSPARIVADCRCFEPWRAVLERLAQARPDVVLLDIGALPAPFDDAVGSIRLAAAATVAAVHTTADPESVLKAVRAGVNDYLYPPLRFTLRKLMERKSQELSNAGRVPGRGRVMGFLSAKGGCGATSIACAIASELAARGGPRGQNALLADLDLRGGVAGFLLQADSPFSVNDALQALRTDAGLWRALVSRVAGGLDVLPAPRAPAVQEPLSAEQVLDFVGFVRAHYDWSVLDLGRGWTPAAFDGFRAADEAFLVFTAELPALNHTRHLVDRFLKDGVPEEKLRLVLNQAPREMCLSVEEIEGVMSLPVFAVVPRSAMSPGDLLIPVSELGRQLYDLSASTK